MSKSAIVKGKYHDFWERNRNVDGYLLKKTILEWSIKIARFLLLFGMCFLILQPILNKISISFMQERDLYDPMVISIPAHFTGENYVFVMDFLEYPNALKNSLLYSLGLAVLQITMCTLVGYGFARFEFPLKGFWFACVILTVVVPVQAISTSIHMYFRFFDIFGIIKSIRGDSGLLGSPIPYVIMSATCMGLKNGLYIYMIRQFFRNIPKELEEAAYVDGCGTLRTFFRIMLPDAKPIITSCFLFAFVWQWTDSFYSKYFLGGVDLLSIKLAGLADTIGGYYMYTLNRGQISIGYTNCMVATGTMLIIVPVILIYLFAQKGFVESLSSTGIKM